MNIVPKMVYSSLLAACMLGGLHATAWAADDAAEELESFTPPAYADIPDDEFGEMIRLGRNIFMNPGKYAEEYVGNDLACTNCHLHEGRLEDSSPMWAAYVRYPRYRSKNDKVNTYTERLQGCFRFSMNGTPPPDDSDVITALTAYSYWLATGAPTGKDLKGFGFRKEGMQQPDDLDREHGKQVFAENCALCHGDDGQGQYAANGDNVFPPLWGPNSFNWGAGMHSLPNAAAFIRDNMPLGRGGTLTEKEAWDVAFYMDTHERPQDPRFTGDIAETRAKYHDSEGSFYGKEVDGRLLGQGIEDE